MISAEELRAESRRLRETIKNTSDPALKQERAAQALELAIRAEAIADSSENVDVLRAKIDRYQRMLSTDDGKSDAHKQAIEKMLSDAGEILQKLSPGQAAA